ncbi:flagellar hook-associated protein 2 [Nitrosospira multiformis ATCC 25196]|uniref:Flagellar hook-associated protein 2 n=1 Tax=Nitrosospira multiformis (strain ATCC 25196 / NCIMB 11849 / C 71) TaxID=323848 RepID=Q2Y9C9_NITMU|nr:flagellar filament capping protein FliD [Nitrosospira multiformis]ABB74642.1 flagellar hook-associated 2-like protein [Nitrosospira multiformis ATCC 25196]SEF72408.1 flagellar hook-associated protein 2 [Nitrosospira multiformis ATCC 25196]
MAITAAGAGSNLDVNGIVSQLMAAERTPLALLQKRESDYQAKLSAYGTLKGALSAFQTAMQGLADPAKYNAVSASAADSSLLTATGNSNGKAVPGSYSVEVQQLAQQQKIRSEGFASTSSTVGSGTLTIQYGTYDNVLNTFTLNNAKPAQTITIEPSSNTLSGVRDAINAANAGVSATIVNDGAGNKLVLTAKDPGAASSLKITVSDDDGGNLDTTGLSALAFDPTVGGGSGKNLIQVQAAQDAKLRIDGIDIVKSSNTITDAIEGVTLSLLKTNAGSPTTLNVSPDTAAAKTAVEAFVKSYNSINQTLSNLSAYNPGAKKGAILQGDSAAFSIQRGIRSALTAMMGDSRGFTSLSQIGVTLQKDGSLAVDSAKLQASMDTGFEQIGRLFTIGGTSTDSLISYEGATDKTVAGNYAVTVTQLATRGSLSGSQAAGLTITAGINDQLNFNVDGVAASITLADGIYASADALAAEVQSKLNGLSGLTTEGISVSVSPSAGVLSIVSSRYGSASSVILTGGNGAGNLLGASPVGATGIDVAGSINGVSATGSGQMLTAAGGGSAEGLRVAIHGGALGTRGTIEFSRGYAERLSKVAEEFLATEGVIATRVEGLNASIKDLDRRQEDFSRRLETVEARYRAQFSALDAMLGSLTQTSQFLQQQLASLPTLNEK